MPELWYPEAVRQPISRNFTPGRAGRAPILIVDHIADGWTNPFKWFNRDAGDDGSSAPFWIDIHGKVYQYGPLNNTFWANGPKCNPNMANPVIARLVNDGMVGMNSVSIAIEHAGKPGTPLTALQIDASRKLHLWISREYSIPLTRTYVVGHYEIDKCNRANCPGPTHPWAQLLGGVVNPMPALDYEREIYQPLQKLKDKMIATGQESDIACALAWHNVMVQNKNFHIQKGDYKP